MPGTYRGVVCGQLKQQSVKRLKVYLNVYKKALEVNQLFTRNTAAVTGVLLTATNKGVPFLCTENPHNQFISLKRSMVAIHTVPPTSAVFYYIFSLY